MTRVFPSPEAIDPSRKWRIESGRAYVDFQKGIMSIPLNDDPHWQLVRAHELAHVAFTPRKARIPKGLTEFTVQACEDYRVNTLAQKSGVDFSAGAPSHIVDAAIIGSKDDLKLSILIGLAAFPDEAFSVMQRLDTQSRTADPRFHDRFWEISDTAREMFRRGRYTWKTTIKVAKYIDSQFQHEKEPNDACGSNVGNGDNPLSGRAYLETPTLERPSTITRSVRSTDEGSLFRQPWRVTTDHRVFRHVSVKKRASVLIDASGSMQLTADDIKAIVQHAPASVVAAYAGHGDSGPLRVLANNGRMTLDDKAYRFPGGNIVDVPALQWLAKQPMPRYWVCDGNVTGINDESHDSITKHCRAIERSAHIVRVPNADTLADRLKSKKR